MFKRFIFLMFKRLKQDFTKKKKDGIIANIHMKKNSIREI